MLIVSQTKLDCFGVQVFALLVASYVTSGELAVLCLSFLSHKIRIVHGCVVLLT